LMLAGNIIHPTAINKQLPTAIFNHPLLAKLSALIF
jgi:hypothetical protein